MASWAASLEGVPLMMGRGREAPEARVYYMDRDGGYYLKSAPAGSLRAEAEKTRFFHEKGLGAEVLSYLTEGERDWILTRAVAGS